MSNQLQTYVDTQVAEISPYKVKSNALLQDAELQDVTDVQSAKEAAAIRKQITAHKTAVANARKEITRQFDDVKKQFIAAERDVLAPAEEAQTIIQKKLLAFEKEEERKRAAEEKRVAEIVGRFTFGTDKLDTVEEIDEQLARVENIADSLEPADRSHPQIKLAYTEAKSSLLSHKDKLTLGAETDEAAVATNQADKEDAALAAELAKKAAEAAKPKMGIKTVTRFEIVDRDLVPRELCEPSDKLIRAFIKAGGHQEIPGVKVWQERSF